MPIEEVDGEGSVKLQVVCGDDRGGERGPALDIDGE